MSCVVTAALLGTLGCSDSLGLSALSFSCRVQAQCLTGYQCHDEVCRPTCLTDNACPGAQRCVPFTGYSVCLDAQADVSDTSTDESDAPDAPCSDVLSTDAVFTNLDSLNTRLWLPNGFEVSPESAQHAVIHEAGSSEAFGFLAWREGQSHEPRLEAARIVSEIRKDQEPIIQASRSFLTWRIVVATNPVEARPALEQRLAFQYGNNTPNPERNTQDPAVIRDALIEAVTGTIPTVTSTGAPCSRVEVYLNTEIRPGPVVLVSGLVACANTFDTREDLAALGRDLGSGSIMAPLAQVGQAALCQEVDGGGLAQEIDMLWVLDRSASMDREMEAVARNISEFVDNLNAAGLDWRIGATTMDAYLLDESAPLPAGLDANTGLVPPGFINPDQVDQLSGVLLSAPQGTVDEKGIASSIAVLSRLEGDPREAYVLRPDAQRVVLWISDEEDADFKDNNVPWSASDTRRGEEVLDKSQALITLDARASGIVTVDDSFCDTLGEVGRGYIAVAEATGGVIGSVCNDDYAATFEALLDTIYAEAATIRLDSTPAIPSAIRVRGDSGLIPRSRSNGWDYNPSNNSITLFGAARGAESLQVELGAWTAR